MESQCRHEAWRKLFLFIILANRRDRRSGSGSRSCANLKGGRESDVYAFINSYQTIPRHPACGPAITRTFSSRKRSRTSGPDRNLARDARPPRCLGIAARKLKINGGVEGGGVSEDDQVGGAAAAGADLPVDADWLGLRSPLRGNNRRAASATF